MAAAQKKYVCAFCARAFTRSEHKQRHERSHTNEKPFHCLHCTSSFVRRDLLQRHCRTVHNTNLNPNTLPSNKSLNNPTTNALDLSSTTSTTHDQLISTSNSMMSDLQSPTTTNTTSNNNSGYALQMQNSRGSFSFDNETGFEAISLTPSTSLNSDIQQQQQQQQQSQQQQGGYKKRKRSSTNGDDVKSIKDNNHDLIHLLSITKKLTILLNIYEPNEVSMNNVNDYFLIGYVNLQKLSKDFIIFDKILNDLLYYLNTSYINQQHNQMSPPIMINNFKIGISYLIVSLGYLIDKTNIKKSIWFFKKSWILLIKKLIPQYNTNNNLIDQIEILNNLFLLSFIYLNYNLQSFNINDNDEDNDDQEQDLIYINNEVILNYLNDISYIIISNLKDLDNNNLIDTNINLFWNIYILLSNYMIHKVPKIYPIFLKKSIINSNDQDSTDLMSLMLKFSKSYINLRQNDENLKNIIVSTLSNELKEYTEGEDRIMIYNNNKNVLHNSIILINKSINYYDPLLSTNKSINIKLFELFKKNLILSSPLKFHELFNNYIFIPFNYYNWNLLSLTLKEINSSSCSSFALNSSQFQSILNNQLNYENSIKSDLTNLINQSSSSDSGSSIIINNNLLIVSYPLIFLNNYLNLKIIDISEFNHLQMVNLNLFVIEWYLIINKILLLLWTDNLISFDDNYILQTLIYLLLDTKSTSLLKKLNILDQNHNQNMNIDAVEELSFNQKWYWILKLKIDSIFDNWMKFIKENNHDDAFNVNVIRLKSNLIKTTNEFIITHENLHFKEDESNQASNNHHHHNNDSSTFMQSSTSLNTYQGHHQSTSSSSSLPIPFQHPMQQQQQQQMSSGNNSQGFFNDNYRRSNSITLGVLGIDESPKPRSYSNSNLNITNSNNNNNNNGSVGYGIYSSYPPPPPILSSNNSTNSSNIGGSIIPNPGKSDVMLPPLRHEEKMINK